MEYKIVAANGEDFPEIIELLEELNLDMEEIDTDQFLVCKTQDKILGAGRIRIHDDCLELCSLGVLENERGKGIGKNIANALIDSNKDSDIFLVTEIPSFFMKVGFVDCVDFPEVLNDKINRCKEIYSCSKPVVMQRTKTVEP